MKRLAVVWLVVMLVIGIVGCTENGLTTDRETDRTDTTNDVPGQPVISSAEATSETEVELQWSAVSGAQEYSVYYSQSPDGRFEKIGTTEDTSCTVYDMDIGTTYWLKVSASNAEGEGEKSEPVEVTTLGGGNSRSNPAGIGESWTITIPCWVYGDAKIEITLLGLVSGNEAWDIVHDANRFNTEPNHEEEYILAKFRIAVLETEDDEPFDIYSSLFDLVSEEGVFYDSFQSIGRASGLEPGFRTEAYPGGTHEGWVSFLVKKDDNPLIVINRGEAGEVWFDLRADQ